MLGMVVMALEVMSLRPKGPAWKDILFSYAQVQEKLCK